MNINMVYGIYKQSGGVTYFRELLFDVNIMVRQHMDMVDILIKEKRKSLNIEAEPWISAELQRSTETSGTGNNKKEDVEEDINHRSIIQESVDLLKETLDMTEDSTRGKNCNDETIGIKNANFRKSEQEENEEYATYKNIDDRANKNNIINIDSIRSDSTPFRIVQKGNKINTTIEYNENKNEVTANYYERLSKLENEEDIYSSNKSSDENVEFFHNIFNRAALRTQKCKPEEESSSVSSTAQASVVHSAVAGSSSASISS